MNNKFDDVRQFIRLVTSKRRICKFELTGVFGRVEEKWVVFGVNRRWIGVLTQEKTHELFRKRRIGRCCGLHLGDGKIVVFRFFSSHGDERRG